MPHSLRVKIKKLQYKGIITDKDCDRLITALDNTQQKRSFDIYEYIKENFEPVENKPGYVWFSKRNFEIINIETLAANMILDIIDKYKAERSNEE